MAGDLRAVPPEHDETVSSVGQRALAFIRWAVNEYGRPGPPGRVVVHCSQAQLTLAYNIGSRGTVAWYVSQLRDVEIVISTRPLVVDLTALEQATGATELGTDDSSEVEAELASLLARQAAQMGQAIQLLADLAATQADIAHALTTRATARTREPNSRKDAEMRDPDRAVKEGKKGDFTNLPSFLDANRASASANGSRGESLGLDEVAEIVEPLRAWCRQVGRSDHLDVNGRRTLAPIGRRALQAGVTAVQREAAADPSITRPVGLLVARARRGDLTPPPPEPPPPPTARPDCPACGGTGSVTAQRMHLGTPKDYLSPCTCLTAQQERDP